jgi:hypothetical protein
VIRTLNTGFDADLCLAVVWIDGRAVFGHLNADTAEWTWTDAGFRYVQAVVH